MVVLVVSEGGHRLQAMHGTAGGVGYKRHTVWLKAGGLTKDELVPSTPGSLVLTSLPIISGPIRTAGHK